VTRVFLDTNVLVYALGEQHRYREPCRRIVRLLADGRLEGETSVEVIQEFIHVRERRGSGRAEALERTHEYVELFGVVHSFEPRDLDRCLSLMSAIADLPARDAVHAATAINRGIGTILSADRDFDAVAGLARVDPADDDAVRALG
jgi:uncharacterized protein